MKLPKKDISQALTDESFWNLFTGDLNQVVSHLLIQSAFLWDARMKKIEKRIKEIIARGGTVCIFIQAPSYWYKQRGLTVQERVELIDFYRRCRLLESWGVHLNLKIKIHQKIAILDGKVHYEGSLNIMSHRDTAENMRRFSIAEEADVIASMHGLDLCLMCNDAKAKHGTGNLQPEPSVRLGESIKRQRRFLGLSQEQLAARCDIWRSQLTNMEKDCKAPLSVLFAVLNALDLEVLLVPKRHALSLSSHLERLIESEFEERFDPWFQKRIENIYRLSPFRLHLPPSLKEEEVQAVQIIQSKPTPAPSSQGF